MTTTGTLTAAERSLRLGDSGPEVEILRMLLLRAAALDPGAPLPAPDPSLFDHHLDRAVRAFQQDRGLVADGIVGRQTALQLDGARWSLGDRVLLLTSGHWMRGDDVSALQERMVVLGVHAGPVDGIFGPVTEASLRELQRGLGLPVDGVCGQPTFDALGALSRSVSGGDAWALRSRGRVAMAGVSLAGKTVVLDPGPGKDGTPGVAGSPPSATGSALSASHSGPSALEPGTGAEESRTCAQESRTGTEEPRTSAQEPRTGTVESEITYDVAARLAERLRGVGARVLLTREPGEAPAEAERAALAESAGADLVISLLAESHASALASGVATYFWGGGRVGQHSATGERLAELIQREITARTDLVDDRSHPCSYDLVRLTRMPAVIVSLGYLTNADDARRLGDPGFRAVLAESILFAVQRLYLAEDDAKTGTLNLSDVQALSRRR